MDGFLNGWEVVNAPPEVATIGHMAGLTGFAFGCLGALFPFGVGVLE